MKKTVIVRQGGKKNRRSFVCPWCRGNKMRLVKQKDVIEHGEEFVPGWEYRECKKCGQLSEFNRFRASNDRT